MGLDYDNSAFYYFSLTMLGMYAVPMTIWASNYAYKAFNTKEMEVRTSLEKSKLAAIKERNAPKKVLFTATFVAHLVVLAVCWVILISLIVLLLGDSDLASFNPYTILGIDTGAEAAEIRKAYRRLSLQFHPDKNPGNVLAEEMFMKVAKAYEALTNEEARKNWEEFGNPDGKQALEVSIGLPTFLLDEKNHYFVLVVYLVVLVIVIPVVIAAWYAHSSKYGENNVMYETYSFFLHALNEHTTVKMLPEVLAGAAENRTAKSALAIGMDPTSELMTLFKTMVKSGQMMKPRFEHQAVLRFNVLLHGHLTRKDMSPPLKAEVVRMLSHAPRLLEAMLEMARSQRWLQTALNVVEFSQLVTQAMAPKDNWLQQLPHFTEAEVGHCIKGKGAVKTLKDYIRQPDDAKKGVAHMSDQQVADVFSVCKILPDVDAKFDIFCDDEAEIAERDLVTLQVTLTRNNIPTDGKARPVHAPFYPTPRLESWWVFLSDTGGSLILGEKITDQAQTVEHRVKFLAPPQAGTYTFVVELKSMDYVGLDVPKVPVKMVVIPAATLPKYVPHQEDVDLDDEPTLFEQVMAGAADDTDSEDDDDDEDGPVKKPAGAAGADDDKSDDGADTAADDAAREAAALTEAERRRRKARIQRKKTKKKNGGGDDDDDDDDEDGN